MGRPKANSDASKDGKIPRIIIRLELVKSAKQNLEQVCVDRGMTQLSVTSRLVEWFAEQPLLIQSAIMGHYSQINVPDAILKEMLSKRRK